MKHNHSQLGFDSLLAETDAKNKANAFEKQTKHLPATMEEAILFHQEQIKNHHQFMLNCDFEEAMHIREEACLLARKLNNNKDGIIADENAPGCVLERHCAVDGEVPLWGQKGGFIMPYHDIEIQIDMDGMFGIGARTMPFLGFSAKAVDHDKRFISTSGFRSFLGCSVKPLEGMTVADFVRCIIEMFVDKELNGKLVEIDKA